MDKLKKFITRVYKMKEQNELPKMNEFFLICLLKIYLDEKDNLNIALENYDKIKEANSYQYYNKIFNKTINGKSVKLINGKYLEKTFEFIKENLIQIESDSKDE